MRTLFFPLRTSVEMFPDPTSVTAAARAKEAVVLYDRVVFEAGIYKIDITDQGSFADWRPPSSFTHDDLADSRQLPEPGTGMSISVGIQPEKGVEAAPETIRTFFQGPLSASYVAEWHTGVIEDLRELDPGWAEAVVIDDNGPDVANLKASIAETRRRIAEASRGVDLDPAIKRFAEGALARDATLAAQMGAAFNVTSLFEPLLAGTGAEPQAAGRVALDILVPDVGGLPWEGISAYREHPGSEDARGKLRDFEERAMVAEPDDPLVFQREVFRAISQDLFAAIEDLQGSLTKDLSIEALKTGISFVPFVGPFGGPGASLAQAVVEEFQEQRTWYAALMKLGSTRT